LSAGFNDPSALTADNGVAPGAWDDDWDEDGYSNFEELMAYSDPRNASSTPFPEPENISPDDNEAIPDNTSNNSQPLDSNMENNGGADPALPTPTPEGPEIPTAVDSGSENHWWNYIPIVGDIIDFFGKVIEAFERPMTMQIKFASIKRATGK